MSVIELMWWVRGHITFCKWDILWNLEKVALKAVDRDLATLPGAPHCIQPTPIDFAGRRSGSVEAPMVHISITPFLPAEKAPQMIPLPTVVNVGHTPPGPTDMLHWKGVTMPLSGQT